MPRGGKRAGAGRKPADTSQIESFIEALRHVGVGRGYSYLDRYRDFNRVFLGTPEGKRVLSQIVDMCEGPVVTEKELENHALLAARAWSKRIGLRISQYAAIPPQQQEPEVKNG
jgi:hypothetical protein